MCSCVSKECNCAALNAVTYSEYHTIRDTIVSNTTLGKDEVFEVSKMVTLKVSLSVM